MFRHHWSQSWLLPGPQGDFQVGIRHQGIAPKKEARRYCFQGLPRSPFCQIPPERTLRYSINTIIMKTKPVIMMACVMECWTKLPMAATPEYLFNRSLVHLLETSCNKAQVHINLPVPFSYNMAINSFPLFLAQVPCHRLCPSPFPDGILVHLRHPYFS